MKKKLRLLLFVCCLGVLALMLAVRLRQADTTLLGARLAGEDDLAAVQAGQEVSPDGCVLHWNGGVLPYDTVQVSYVLPQTGGEALHGALTSSWGEVYLPATDWAADPAGLIQTGVRLPVLVSDGSRWCRLSVYLTGLPALAIQTQESVPFELDPEAYGQSVNTLGLSYNYSNYTLFWPGGNARQQVTKGRLEWHWRGNASLFAKKKGYRLNLLDAVNNPKEQDLLGLGKDADWILLNFSTDCTRTRDKLSWQLWEQLVRQTEGYNPPGIQVEYVELYLNDTYLGVYGLCRPVSRDTLSLSANDRLYKWRQGTMIQDAALDELERQGSLAWLNKLEVAFPKSFVGGVWQPMRVYVNQYYLAERPAAWQTLAANTNLANLIDTALYKQFVCGVDNLFQNQYVLQKAEDGLFYRLPWDMDYTFGDIYHDLYYLDETQQVSMDLTATVIPDMELDALWAADPAATQQLVAERWAQLRSSIFTEENVASMMNGLTAQLKTSGALDRELALWGKDKTYPENPAHFRTLEVDETLDELHRRLLFLDEYMAEYTPPSREGFSALPQ